jgi:hypothetical protein
VRLCHATGHTEIHVNMGALQNMSCTGQPGESWTTCHGISHLLASAAYFLKKGSSGVRVMCSRSVPYMRASSRFLATRPAGTAPGAFARWAAERWRRGIAEHSTPSWFVQAVLRLQINSSRSKEPQSDCAP